VFYNDEGWKREIDGIKYIKNGTINRQGDI
jgi:hypothetical protein